MNNNNIENNSVPSTVEQTMAPVHQETEVSATVQATPLGKISIKDYLKS